MVHVCGKLEAATESAQAVFAVRGKGGEGVKGTTQAATHRHNWWQPHM